MKGYFSCAALLFLSGCVAPIKQPISSLPLVEATDTSNIRFPQTLWVTLSSKSAERFRYQDYDVTPGDFFISATGYTCRNLSFAIANSNSIRKVACKLMVDDDNKNAWFIAAPVMANDELVLDGE